MIALKRTSDLCVLLALEVDGRPPRSPIHANVTNDQLTDSPESQQTLVLTYLGISTNNIS